MKFVIKDEIRGRIRVRVKQNEMTCREADILQYYFDGQECVTKVKVNERVNDVVICYSGSRSHVIKLLQQFNYKMWMFHRHILIIQAGNSIIITRKSLSTGLS